MTKSEASKALAKKVDKAYAIEEAKLQAVEAYKKRLVEELRAEMGDWPDFSSENMRQYAYLRDNGMQAAIKLVNETFYSTPLKIHSTKTSLLLDTAEVVQVWRDGCLDLWGGE